MVWVEKKEQTIVRTSIYNPMHVIKISRPNTPWQFGGEGGSGGVVVAVILVDGVDPKGDTHAGQDKPRKRLCEELGGTWRSERCVDGSRDNIMHF